MKLRTPTFLYFDLGNVVLPFDYLIAIRQMAELAGVPAAEIQQIVFDSGLQMAYECGAVTTVQFYAAFCEQTGKRPDLDGLLVASSDMFQADETVVDLILRLRGFGYRTGLLSNTCEAHWQFCVNHKFPCLARLFEVTALSYELGAMKPEAAIYQAAARLAGVAPAEIFFVDDRMEHVEGACRAGFDAVLFTGVADLIAALVQRGIRVS